MKPARSAYLRLALAASLLTAFLGAPERAAATTLEIYPAAAGVGNTLFEPGPLSDFQLDVDYDASTAEGGTLFGFTEVLFRTTGDLVFTSTFSCDAAGCLHAPMPVMGTEVRITGGDGINGEVGVFDLATFGITGTFGSVEVAGGIGGGSYLVDLFDDDGVPDSVEMLSQATLLTVVPEPASGLLMAGGLAALALHRRRVPRAR